MCRMPTPNENRVPCNRCGDCANPTDGWEHAWPLYGHMVIGFAAQAGLFFSHHRLVFPEHPALKSNGAQELILEWGNGYKYDSTGKYRLCYNCQKELIATLGKFFRADEGLTYSDGQWFCDGADGESIDLGHDYEGAVATYEKLRSGHGEQGSAR